VEVNVRAAGAGKTTGELAEAERAAQSHGSDREPDDQEPEWGAEGFGHAGRSEEDADGDGFAGDGGSGRAQAELAAEVWGVGGLAHR
jgi:hypothetical protein